MGAARLRRAAPSHPGRPGRGPGAGREAASPLARPLDPTAVESLQRTAGNATVSTALAGAALQRTSDGFSPEESRWIAEVWSLPDIQLLFTAYPSVPEPVLHRVRGDSAEGTTVEGEMIEVGDRTYERTDERAGSRPEDEFKGTLLHELFHYFEFQAQDIDPTVAMTPTFVVEALMQPEALGLPRYAFGWFVHPRAQQWLHFDLDIGWTGLTDPRGLRRDEGGVEAELAGVREDRSRWESSPMPQSGKSIDPEEDASETLALFLTSPRSRQELKARYPLRFGLMRHFFGILKRQTELAAGVPLR